MTTGPIVQTEPRTTSKALWLAIVAGTIMAAAVIVLWYVIDQRAHEHAGSSTDHSIHMNELLVQQDAENRLLALDRLAHRSVTNDAPSQFDWQADAKRHLTDMPGFVAIHWIDTSFESRWHVAADPDGDATLDVAEVAVVRVALERSRESNARLFSDVFTDAEGTPFVAVIVPVLHHVEFEGVIAGILQPGQWLDSVIGRLQSADHHIEIMLQDQSVYRHEVAGDVPDAHQFSSHRFSAGGLDWTMRVTPTTSFLSTGHADSSTLVLVVGLLLSALTALAVYFGFAARDRSHQYHDIALQLATLFRNLPGMAYRRNDAPGTPMAFVSEGCSALSGYPRSAFSEGDKDWLDLVHPDDRVRVVGGIQNSLGTDDAFEVEYRIIDADGDIRWMRERGRAVASEVDNQTHLEGFVTDITGQRSAENEAREHREQLAHVDRLNMLGEMASGIAHEINQPLSAIALLVQASDHLVRTEQYGRLSEILDKLLRHAHRASSVIDRVQRMAKRHASSKERVGCEELVRDVARLAEPEAGIRDIEIAVETQVGLPDVSVDAVQIQQVVLNLLRNGMEAMQSIDCRNGNAITLQARLRDDSTIEFSVIDKGCGVDKSSVDKLFAPFSTTKKSGMGMGLSISRAIVTAHGGQLDFRNNSDCGATFFFVLPAAEQRDST
jgi:PAS domain S-box-containing protein